MGYVSAFRPGLFEGQSIIVTGGGTGIGRCIAHELASLGAHATLVGRRADKLEAVRDEIREDGGAADVHACDVRDEEAVAEMVARVVERHGRVDGLVNNAGGQFRAPIAETTKKGWDAVVATNLTGGFLCAREVYTQSMRAHGGAIVNILLDMWQGVPGMAHSAAARAGMLNFTQTAATEWAPANVRVNAVAPGWIASSGMDTYPESLWPFFRGLARISPMRRLGTESETSAAVVFLLSEAASFITGSCLRVDAGVPNVRPNWKIPDHDPAPAFDGFHRAVTPRIFRREREGEE